MYVVYIRFITVKKQKTLARATSKNASASAARARAVVANPPSSPVVVVLTRIVSAAGTVAPPLDSLALVRRVRRVQRLHVG